MKNKRGMIHILLFLFLVTFPIQTFAHGEDHDHDSDHPPWLLDGHDDHDHEYEETGANIPLLSTFAAINGGFILFGAIRKYNKKRKNSEA